MEVKSPTIKRGFCVVYSNHVAQETGPTEHCYPWAPGFLNILPHQAVQWHCIRPLWKLSGSARAGGGLTFTHTHFSDTFQKLNWKHHVCWNKTWFTEGLRQSESSSLFSSSPLLPSRGHQQSLLSGAAWSALLLAAVSSLWTPGTNVPLCSALLLQAFLWKL